MKLWEVIKALTEDPTKKFELSDRGIRERIGSDGSYLCYSMISQGMVSDVPALEDNVDVNNNNWQLVRQPVTWQEAIQAWSEGSDIKECFPRSERLYRSGDTIHLNENDVLNGTWYVED